MNGRTLPVGITTLALIGGAFSQTNSAPVSLPAVEVTGTRLDRPLDESPVPANVVTRAQIDRSGRTNLSDMLRELPEVPVANINDNVAISSTHGAVAMDLRGLGPGNTLILVNGRRTTVSANSLDTNVFVDANRFPPGMLERVEILKGGASAVYGADAVAGVINLITRRQPNGGELRVSYGNAFDTDASELNASLATGATRGRLGISVSADFMSRHALANRDRYFSRTANLVPEFVATFTEYARLPASQLANIDGRSLTAPNARVILVAGQVNGQNGVNIPGLAPGIPITALPGTGGAAAGTLAQATPGFNAPFRDITGGQFNATAAATFDAPEITRGDPNARNLFNFNNYTWLIPEAQRAGAGVHLDYDGAAGPVFFADVSVQHNRSHTEFQPPGITAAVPRTNPYNPFGVDVTAVWRIAEVGPRRSQVVDDSASALVGMRAPAKASFAWETAASYSHDAFTDTITNAMSATRVLAALTSANRAIALNPFGGETYRNDPALLESAKIKTWTAGWADLLSFDAKLAHDVFQTRAGAIRVVGYLEHRRERFNAFSDSVSQVGDALGQGQTGSDSRWSRDVTAFAGETRIPLIPSTAGLSGVSQSRLSIEAAARSEIFNGSFRSGLRPSAGVVARPTPSLLLRASHAWTFRAPTLPQLFAPQSEGYANSIPDPRRPAALTGDQNDGPNVSRLVRNGGNPDLSPEKGRVLQAGAMWRPHAAPGLAFEASWFRYNMENIINSVSTNYVLQNELGGLGALVHRDPGTETYTNRASAPILVLTGPNGQTTQVAPGQSATVPGRLQRLDLFIVNLSRHRLIGWDFAVHQKLNTSAAGLWTGSLAATYTAESSDAFDRYSPLVSTVGSPGGPRWRGRATLDWERGAWSAGSTFTYTPSSGSHADLNYLKPYRVVHVRAAWTSPRDSILRGAQISVGIDDVFNESVPIAADPPLGFWVSGVARPQGRSWRVAAKQSW